MNLMQKYATLSTIVDEAKTREAINDLHRSDRMYLESVLIDDPRAGMMFLQPVSYGGSPAFLEMIPHNAHEDSMSTLYRAHPCFNSKGELIRARVELIETIEDMLQAMPNTLMVRCKSRKRPALLRELGTRQLYDLLGDMVSRVKK